MRRFLIFAEVFIMLCAAAALPVLAEDPDPADAPDTVATEPVVTTVATEPPVTTTEPPVTTTEAPVTTKAPDTTPCRRRNPYRSRIR